jgi:hypothetical protein
MEFLVDEQLPDWDSFGKLSQHRVSPDSSSIEGPALQPCVVGQQTACTIVAKSYNGTQVDKGGDRFDVRVDFTAAEGGMAEPVKYDILDKDNGQYSIEFKGPPREGTLEIGAWLRGRKLKPFSLAVSQLLSIDGGTSNILNGTSLEVLHRMLPAKANRRLRLLHQLGPGGEGSEPASFAAAVNGHARVLTVLQAVNTNHVFGGYFEHTFGSRAGWTNGHDNDFVFTLGPRGTGPASKLRKPPGYTEDAVYLSSCCGLHMGYDGGRNCLVAFCSWELRLGTTSCFTQADPQFSTPDKRLVGVGGRFAPLHAEVYACS